MKTIEILSNGREVQFTTKSVTVAGKEYPYSHISELRHSAAKRIYGFKCDDEVVLLAGFGHKREVSVMECSHGGDEADGFIFLFGFLNGCGEGSYGSKSLHCMMGLIE